MKQEANRTEEILVKASNASVAYGGVPVVHDINLEIGTGKTFGLIGLNGAGKTSFIKTILGLRDLHEGSISVFGKQPSDTKSRASLAYLPERFEPPWFLSGLEFLKFSLKLYNRKFMNEEAYDYAQALALDKAALKRRVHTYSKGMRQKLGLISVLMSGCRFMVLDEPMSGLDPQARSLVKDILRQKHDQETTTFLCSHILADMDELCDQIAVMHQGRLHFCGTPQEFRSINESEHLERAFLHFIEKQERA